MKIPACLPLKVDVSTIESLYDSVAFYKQGGLVTALGCNGFTCTECVAEIEYGWCVLQNTSEITNEVVLRWLLKNEGLWEVK